jgi:5-methyltetrahydrofolate--homocysteine methyltransferase
VLATVKGDVHDIGKNIVGVVLQCNGFEVVDLGVMVPHARILEAANENDADMIGLSGLITPSLDEMVTVAEEMQRAGMTRPLLIGGATTSKVHTALRIAPAYAGPVVHVLDASRAVGVATTLVSDTGRDAYVADIAADYQKVRDARAGKGQNELFPLAEARARGFAADFAMKPHAPAHPGVHRFDDWDLADLRAHIDWTPFFRAWELAGNYPAILNDPVVGESASGLYADAQAMLDRIVAEKWLTARGVAGLWPCRREGDDVVLLSSPLQGRGGSRAAAEGKGAADRTDGAGVPLSPTLSPEGERELRLPFLRQQIAKREGRANMCLADFVDPAGDWIGGFAVGIHGIDTHLARFSAAHDDYNDILLKALADRLAERSRSAARACAARAVGLRRRRAADQRSADQGTVSRHPPRARLSGLSEHSLKRTLFDLLDAEATGLSLTESFAMLPTAAVSGFYFGHPRPSISASPGSGATRWRIMPPGGGVDLAQAERWLRPNLD